MTIRELVDTNMFKIINLGDNIDRKLTKPFCCDLLSIAMSKIPEGAAWVTVMGNINTLAVATLTDAGCVILAERSALDAPALEKAISEKVTVLSTEEPIFEAALTVHHLLNDSPQL